MAVFLTILKIIGITLLSVIGLVLVILCYLLFVPFKYQISGRSYEELTAAGRFSSFFGAFCIRFFYDKDNGFRYGIHLFGFKKPFLPKDSEAIEETDVNSIAGDDEYVDAKQTGDAEDVSGQASAQQPKADTSVSKDNESKENRPTERSHKGSEKKKKKDRSKTDDDEEGESFIERFRRYVNISRDPSTHRAVRFLWEKTVKLLRILAPKRMEADMSFSTGEPDITGQITGLLAMCPAVYAKKVDICPDFAAEKAYALGYITLFGHFTLWSILWLLLVVFLDKDCRKLYKAVK